MSKNDPILRSVRVDIKYRSSDGYVAKAGYASSAACEPKNALVAAADELARICELFGFGDEAIEAASDAVGRVRAWRKEAGVA